MSPNTSDGFFMVYKMVEKGGFISNCFLWSTNESYINNRNIIMLEGNMLHFA